MALTPLGQAYQSYLKNNQGTPGNNTAQVASQTQVPTPGATGSGIAAAYGAAPKPYVPPTTNTAPKPGMGTQSPTNTATSPKVPMPSTGYGGATYGSSGAVNDALEANTQYIKDPNNRQSEIDRALAVIQARQAQGLDTSAQTKYLTSLGYNPEQRNDTVPTPGTGIPVPTPGTGSFTAPNPSNTAQIPTYNPAVPVMDEAAIRAYAEKQVARKLADARLTADQSIANNQLTAKQQSDALKANYDKLYADITENRNVENVDNARRLSPFSGRSDYAQGMIEQNRARTDRENQSTLQTNQGNIAAQSAQLQQQINDKYTALSNAAPDEREALFQSIKNDERNYDLMVHGQLVNDAQANSQLNNTAFNQALQTFQTNYGVGQDQIHNDAQYGGTYNGGQSLQGQAAALNNKEANWNAYMDLVNQTGNLGKGPTQTWGQLVNNANSGAQTLNGQNQQLNNTQVMAQLTGKLPNGQKTTDQQQRDLENQWTLSEQTGTISDTIAKIYGIPKGTSTQAAKQFAMSFGQQEDQNYISYINAANKDGGSSAQTVSPTAAGQMLSQSLSKVVGDNNGKPVYGTITDPGAREKAFVDAWNASGVAPGTDTIEMLSKAGYTPAEIATYKVNHPEAFNSGGASSGSYSTEINTAASKWSVPTDLIEAVIDAESSGNAKAVSGAGAQGLMQLMPATAKGLGVSNSFDPAQNINGGTQYLKGLLDTYDGDYAKALAGYNAGGSRVKTAVSKYGNDWLSHMPQETQNYVKKILSKLGG